MSFPTPYQEFIYRRTYARWVDAENRRETWQETTARFEDFFGKKVPSSKKYEFHKACDAIRALEVMPSMRAIWAAGLAAEREPMGLYNCAYLEISSVKSFAEVLYVLMNGTGVGFSVERQVVAKLPDIPAELNPSEDVIVVPDSKKGWAEAFYSLLRGLYAGEIKKWDVSRVRPKGAKLKTFGGRSSGPGPLVDLFEFTVRMFKGAKGRKLNSLEAHDIVTKTASVVVVGGVRRSACISLSNLSDDRMAHAKDGMFWDANPQRMLANNSVAYTEKPDPERFMQEWLNLIRSKSGERGIFNRESAKFIVSQIGRRDPNHEFGCNPCLHPDSMIETVDGRVKIKDITEPTHVYTMLKDGSLGIRKASASWKTKENAETLEIETYAGHVVRCTPDHKIFTENDGWVEAKDLQIGDTLVHLKRSRRGVRYSGVSLTSDENGYRHQAMEHHLVWSGVNGTIPDGWDIHHINGDTYDNSIDNLAALNHSLHSTITRNGCENNHMVNSVMENGKRGFVSTGPKKKKTIVPMPQDLRSNITNQYSMRVKEIRVGERTDVYDLTVEDTHNFIADFTVVHNCSEILLRPNQTCNLSEVVVRPNDTIKTLKEKVRYATILGIIQSTYTDFQFVNRDWKRNCDEERLLGVSLTGLRDHAVLGHKSREAELMLIEMKQTAIDTAKEWSNILQINMPAAITCTKPSGSVSQLVDSASGLHARYSPYYVRRVRVTANDPLAKMLIEYGVPYNPEVGETMENANTWVFEFPIKAPDTAVMRDDENAIQQLEYWKMIQTCWCEHKPSITVFVRDDEWIEVASWVYKNWNYISGISFLPYDGGVYQLAPYEEITEEQYTELVEKMPEIDFDKLIEYEREDTTQGSREFACQGNSCELA